MSSPQCVSFLSHLPYFPSFLLSPFPPFGVLLPPEPQNNPFYSTLPNHLVYCFPLFYLPQLYNSDLIMVKDHLNVSLRTLTHA